MGVRTRSSDRTEAVVGRQTELLQNVRVVLPWKPCAREIERQTVRVEGNK